MMCRHSYCKQGFLEMNLIAAMSKNNFLLLLVITILLSSCASSSFFDDNSSNYNDKNDGDCELATNIAFELMDVLFSDNNEEEAEFIYETEEDSIVPYYTAISEDKISLSYVLLKPANFPFPKLHEQLEAKRIITGKINLYETYDDYGEKYFLVEQKSCPKVKPPRKDVRCLQQTVYVEEEMGTMLGRSHVLFQSMQCGATKEWRRSRSRVSDLSRRYFVPVRYW